MKKRRTETIERRDRERRDRLLQQDREAAEKPEKERAARATHPCPARRHRLFFIRRNLFLSLFSLVLFGPATRDQRPGEKESRNMRDGSVAQQEAVVKDERAVEPVEEAGRKRTPKSRAGSASKRRLCPCGAAAISLPSQKFSSLPSEKCLPHVENRKGQRRARETREQELQDPRRPDG